MGCGLPVVAFNVGGISEIILDEFNGLLCVPESFNDLAIKIELASAKKWNRSNWARDNFSWHKWGVNIINEYENQAHKKTRVDKCVEYAE